LLLRAAEGVDVSIPRWAEMLRRYDPRRGRRIAWRPVMSNIPRVDDPAAVAAIRRRHAPPGGLLLGSFGTFGPLITPMLAAGLPALLDGHAERAGLLIGRGSEAFGAAMLAAHPGLAGRLHAAGALSPEELSLHLQACDLLVQPYPDGVCSRRSSLMGGLAHGAAIVTTTGQSTEPLWAESGCVALVPRGDVAALVRAAEGLLADPEARARLGASARRVYDERFATERLVAGLLADLRRDRPGPRPGDTRLEFQI
jgi:glycosyltransferase involved in cell wall biosynthesis